MGPEGLWWEISLARAYRLDPRISYEQIHTVLVKKVTRRHRWVRRKLDWKIGDFFHHLGRQTGSQFVPRAFAAAWVGRTRGFDMGGAT